MNDTSSETDNRKPAGFFSRAIAFVLDLFLLAILELMAGFVVFLILSFFNYGKILRYTQSLLGIESQIGQFTSLMSPIIFLVILSYFVFFWTFLGYTPGKALLGLRIVRQDGGSLSVGRAIIRFIGYWVSAIPLFLGFIWILIDRQHEAWHDKISNTHVIYTPKF